MDNTYTLATACQALDCHPRTLAKWLDEQGIVPSQPPGDKRRRRLTIDQVELLAALYEKPLRIVYDPLTLARRNEELKDENARLRTQLADLQRRLAQVDRRVIVTPRPQLEISNGNDFVSKSQRGHWMELHGVAFNTVRNWQQCPMDRRGTLEYALGRDSAAKIHRCDDTGCPCYSVVPTLES